MDNAEDGWPPRARERWVVRMLTDLGWYVLPEGKHSHRWFVLRLWLARPIFWLADRLR
jgi:hypothetical protein